MKRAWLFAPVLLLGCRSAAPPPDDAEAAHVRDLEARVAWLETQARMSAFLDDEILDLELRRAAMLVGHEPGHPAVLDLDRKILALEKVRDLQAHARREAMRRRLEAERETLLDTYTTEHPKVQVVDAKIAYLRAG